MTCMFRLSCALLDLLAVSVERLHDLVCAHKVTKKTTYCKSSKGESQALLVWVGVGWSCGELCKPFFCANFAPMPVYRLLNVADQLPLHIFRCNGVSGGRWDADRHTHTGAHTHTHVHIQTFMSEAAVRGQRFCSPEILRMKNTGQRERQTETLTIWLEAFLDQQRLCLLPRRTTSNPTARPGFLLPIFWGFVCFCVHAIWCMIYLCAACLWL